MSFGTPKLRPAAQANMLSRRSGGIGTDRVPENTSAQAAATPLTASVAMNEECAGASAPRR